MAKRKILFLGESYRADAITWITGLKEFGDFEIVTWELKTPNTPLKNRILRILEYLFAPIQINKIVTNERPDMIIAERTTSYGFLAALSNVPLKVIAQQGRTDLWPENSILLPLKKRIQRYAFKKASLIHAWGPVMTPSMITAKVDMNKVLVLAKGINLQNFQPAAKAPINKIHAIVTRSLLPEYRHACIIQAFGLLHQKGYDFQLTIVGHGAQLSHLQQLAYNLHIEDKVHFTGRIPNTALPNLLQQSN
ncbi:MAG: glycosyltransferase, partial [Flavobacterium sp.]